MRNLDFEVNSKSIETMTISNEDVRKFADLTGDQNSLHTDSEYANQEGPFSATIVHGVLVMGVVSNAIANYRGDILIDQISDLNFVSPVHIGDKVEAVCTISEVEGRKATVDIDVRNAQTDELLIEGESEIFDAEGLDLE